MLSGISIKQIVEASRTVAGDRQRCDITDRDPPYPFINIVPWAPENVGPNSVDLTLSTEPLRIVDREQLPIAMAERCAYIDLDAPLPTRPVPWSYDEKGAYIILKPHRLYLASTTERTETHGIVPQIAGRSSIGRRGLFVHVTAGFGDDGFSGRWTLELVATEYTMLRPGRRICQVWFSRLDGASQSYAGQYQNQTGIEAPKTGVNDRKSTPEEVDDDIVELFPRVD